MVKTVKKAAKRRPRLEMARPRLRKLTRRQAKTAVGQKAAARPLISSFQLVRQTFELIIKNWRLLGAVVLVYLILNVVFASGISSLNSSISNIRDNLSTGQHQFATALGGFSGLLGSAGAGSSATGSTLQTLLIILESLVIIWALRQLFAGKAFGVKNAYYQSTAQLVPFLLVLAVLFIQFLPVSLGATALSFIFSNGVNSGALTVVFGLIYAGLVAWSVYMISASIFALYIVTLPEMTPLAALRSAKNLVKFRRLKIIRRLLFLPIFSFLAAGLIIIPLILWVSWLVLPAFYLLSMIGILFIHGYLYGLYRELLS